MSIIAMVNLAIKEESVDDFKKFFKEIISDTRSHQGCQGIQLYQSKESPTKFTIHAKWDSEEAQKKYMAWRMETGSFNELEPMLSEPLSMKFFDVVDE